jgi:hypothetical protein
VYVEGMNWRIRYIYSDKANVNGRFPTFRFKTALGVFHLTFFHSVIGVKIYNFFS